MDTSEELKACFQQEIDANSQKRILQLRQEMEAIKMRTEQELMEEASERAERWYAQEEEELCAEHAVAMSHLNDDNHRRLMKERDTLVQGLFERVKEQIQAFHHSDAYVKEIKRKLELYTASHDVKGAVLMLGSEDESLLPAFLKVLGKGCTGQVDDTILLGGYRLIMEAKGRLIDETYDSAINEARANFLQTSGLTIS